jgi:hypothetical protein
MIEDKILGPSHPRTNVTRGNIAKLLLREGRLADALDFAKAALAAHENMLGPRHRWVKESARITAEALLALGRARETTKLCKRYGIARSRGQKLSVGRSRKRRKG